LKERPKEYVYLPVKNPFQQVIKRYKYGNSKLVSESFDVVGREIRVSMYTLLDNGLI